MFQIKTLCTESDITKFEVDRASLLDSWGAEGYSSRRYKTPPGPYAAMIDIMRPFYIS